MLKRNIKLKLGTLGLILIVMLSVPLVSAFGVTPARNNLDFEEGLSYSGTFRIINGEMQPLIISISKQGKLADYVSVADNFIFKEGEKEKTVPYKLNLPRNLPVGVLEQGTNAINFFISSESELVDVGGDKISAEIRVVTSLIIRVPYDEKYAESELFVLEGDAGGRTLFIMPVQNFGNDELKSVSAKVRVHDSDGGLVEEVTSERVMIPIGEVKELRTVWNALSGPGIYSAEVVINYDGGKIEIDREFTIEGKRLNLEGVNVGEFIKGDAVRFDVLIENVWDEDLDNVWARMEVYDLEDNVVSTFTTQFKDIESGEKNILTGYLETEGFEEGQYITKILVYYGDKAIEKRVNTFVSAEGITTDLTYEESFSLNYTLIIVGGLALLVLINIIWFIFFKKRD
ncbi:hypothetical protein HOF78_01080 [Candidatus Woesearchaeota archaeon]|nr:hypothetical protein [Candidatus Woesearchaeota archaeon]